MGFRFELRHLKTYNLHNKKLLFFSLTTLTFQQSKALYIFKIVVTRYCYKLVINTETPWNCRSSMVSTYIFTYCLFIERKTSHLGLQSGLCLGTAWSQPPPTAIYSTLHNSHSQPLSSMTKCYQTNFNSVPFIKRQRCTVLHLGVPLLV